MSDPVHTAWRALGQPEPDRPAQLIDGLCCRCGTVSHGYATTGTKGVVSDAFSDWDRLAWRHAGTNFCAPCTWALRTPELRWYAHIIRPDTATRAGPGDLATALSRPLGETVVTVPISMQKHLLPYATWGVVATDNITLPWGVTEANLLAVYTRLHSLGFGAAAIAEPAPRWATLSKLDTVVDVLRTWPQLDVWREAPHYLAVAARTVRKPKENV